MTLESIVMSCPSLMSELERDLGLGHSQRMIPTKKEIKSDSSVLCLFE